MRVVGRGQTLDPYEGKTNKIDFNKRLELWGKRVKHGCKDLIWKDDNRENTRVTFSVKHHWQKNFFLLKSKKEIKGKKKKNKRGNGSQRQISTGKSEALASGQANNKLWFRLCNSGEKNETEHSRDFCRQVSFPKQKVFALTFWGETVSFLFRS